ncbi:MAG: pilus assembly protein PilP [Xanthomonadales bacterium]|nr:pilus assembly protein PilP [Xanthomonadales bacterium]
MRRIGKQIRHVAGMILVVMFLVACSESTNDLEQYIVSVKERPADPISPIPPVKTFTPYEYEGIIGRDPFRQSISEGSDDVRSSKGTGGPRPDFDRSKEYLERYELDTLSMVGTFSNDESYWALIRDPEGIIHRVLLGNYMGKNHGEVVNISGTEVDLSELISDGADGWLVREASIALGEG